MISPGGDGGKLTMAAGETLEEIWSIAEREEGPEAEAMVSTT